MHSHNSEFFKASSSSKEQEMVKTNFVIAMTAPNLSFSPNPKWSFPQVTHIRPLLCAYSLPVVAWAVRDAQSW
jgi:hypothetical protein